MVERGRTKIARIGLIFAENFAPRAAFLRWQGSRSQSPSRAGLTTQNAFDCDGLCAVTESKSLRALNEFFKASPIDIAMETSYTGFALEVKAV